jgi:hypothetical protein
MNAIVNADSVRRGSAEPETSGIASEKTKITNRLKSATTFAVQPLSRYFREILPGFVWVLATLYLVGAAVLVVAILYAHFSGKLPGPIMLEPARILRVPQM